MLFSILFFFYVWPPDPTTTTTTAGTHARKQTYTSTDTHTHTRTCVHTYVRKHRGRALLGSTTISVAPTLAIATSAAAISRVAKRQRRRMGAVLIFNCVDAAACVVV